MIAILFCFAACLLFLAGCDAKQTEEVILATTTSTDASGLLDALLPAFKKKTGITVHKIPQGTGKALRSGELGNVDVVLVHARALEDKFIADGYGIGRRDVMHNDFIIVGPAEDPAGIKGSSPAEALKKIMEKKSTFCSRGDNSGTHFKEKELWKAAGLDPADASGKWYLELGKGMGGALVVANEKKAYTLTDRSTFITYKMKIALVPLVEGDENLFNPYGVIAVNPEKHPNVNYNAAKKFIDWLVSPEAQKLIADYKKNGEHLFFPDAVK
ncbi:MAG: ABC transporter substrate-binding protein [Planctomycetota bacterium]|jgi:tungstate transport system substrate-binding protein